MESALSYTEKGRNMFTISTDPKDVEAGLAPEHYGDPNKSCQGNADD